MNGNSNPDVLGYAAKRLPRERPEPLRCLLFGIAATVLHAVVGVLYWPVKFAIDHGGSEIMSTLSVATDVLFPVLLPLPWAWMFFGINQGMHGSEEYRALVLLSLANSVVYGLLGAMVYRAVGRRRTIHGRRYVGDGT